MSVNGGRVRADLMVGCWTLEKVGDKVRVDYIVGIDFKGTIPDCILFVL